MSIEKYSIEEYVDIIDNIVSIISHIPIIELTCVAIYICRLLEERGFLKKIIDNHDPEIRNYVPTKEAS